MKFFNSGKREIQISEKEIESSNKELSIGKFKIKFENFPKCRLCGSDLCFIKEKNTYKIFKCENDECDTHNFHPEKRIIHFLSDKDYADYSEYRKSKSCFTLKYWINKGYSENEAKEKLSELQKSNSKKLKPENRFIPTKENLEKKYGHDEAVRICREKSNLTPEFWLKRGYSLEEAKAEIAKRQDHNVKKCLDYVKKHPECRKSNQSNQVKYWINLGFSEDEAKQKVSERQRTFSLEKCIKKYGEIEGRKRFEMRQLKWQTTLHQNGNLHVGYSSISQKLFDSLLEFYSDENKDYIFYGSKNKEYSIRYENKNYIYDFVDLNNRKIIEFQGDIYHANPIYFKEDDFPNPFDKNRSAKEIWEHDKLKYEIAKCNRF